MLHAVMAAGFEHVGETDQVAQRVGLRILQRIAHAGLGGEMHDAIGPDFVEQCAQRQVVGDIELGDADLRAKRRNPVALELRVVIIVEVVETDHGLAARGQRLARIRADEAGRAGDEDCHARTPVRLLRSA